MATNKKTTKKATTKKKAATTTTAAPALPPVLLFSREDALRTGRIPLIAGHERTPAGVESELASMPADFLRTNVPPALLDREAEEMIRLADDVAVFATRGIPVTSGHFELIALLRAKLPKHKGDRDVATAAYQGFDQLEDSHAEALRACISKMKLLCRASGISTELCSLNGAKGNLRMMDAGAAIIARCTPHLALFQPEHEARAQLAQIREYVESMARLRTQQAAEAGLSVVTTEGLHRVKRLILDCMRYVGVRGEYVFADDATRLPGYRLQHIGQWSSPGKKKARVGSDGDVATFSGGSGGDD